REREKKVALPVRRVCSRAAWFIQPIMSTWPVSASCTMAGTRPWSLKRIVSVVVVSVAESAIGVAPRLEHETKRPIIAIARPFAARGRRAGGRRGEASRGGGVAGGWATAYT